MGYYLSISLRGWREVAGVRQSVQQPNFISLQLRTSAKFKYSAAGMSIIAICSQVAACSSQRIKGSGSWSSTIAVELRWRSIARAAGLCQYIHRSPHAVVSQGLVFLQESNLEMTNRSPLYERDRSLINITTPVGFNSLSFLPIGQMNGVRSRK